MKQVIVLFSYKEVLVYIEKYLYSKDAKLLPDNIFE